MVNTLMLVLVLAAYDSFSVKRCHLINSMLKQINFGDYHISNVKSRPCDGTVHTTDIVTTCVMTFDISIE